jgi:hypothetical protein
MTVGLCASGGTRAPVQAPGEKIEGTDGIAGALA